MHGLILWNIGVKFLFSLCTPMMSPFSWDILAIPNIPREWGNAYGLEWVWLSLKPELVYRSGNTHTVLYNNAI